MVLQRVQHESDNRLLPTGTDIKVIVSNTLDNGSDGEDTKQLIERAIATVSIATFGNIQTVFMIKDNPDPIPGLNEVTVTDYSSPQDTGCIFERGCVHIESTEPGSGVMISSRSTLRKSIQPSDAFVHVSSDTEFSECATLIGN